MDSPLIHALLLGILQGLTEFLPISSSGHLALAQKFLPGFRQPGLLLDTLLHVGTLAAIIVFFRKDLISLARVCLQLLQKPRSLLSPGNTPEAATQTLLLGILLAQLPTGIIGLLLENQVEHWVNSVPAVGAALLITAALLTAGEFLSRRRPAQSTPPSPLQSLLIGAAQGLAVIPGISRSGATIAVGRSLGLAGADAARFSFLISLPAVAGAALYSLFKHRSEIILFSSAEIAACVLGPLAAGLTGYLALALLVRLIKNQRLLLFAPYCALLGAGAIIFSLLSS